MQLTENGILLKGRYDFLFKVLYLVPVQVLRTNFSLGDNRKNKECNTAIITLQSFRYRRCSRPCTVHSEWPCGSYLVPEYCDRRHGTIQQKKKQQVCTFRTFYSVILYLYIIWFSHSVTQIIVSC